MAHNGSAQVDSFDASYLESIRVCVLSGDKAPVDLVQTLKRNVPVIDLYSGDGATEAGIWSFLLPMSCQLADNATFMPDGRATRKQAFHVLISRLEPCPTFVAGELFVGKNSPALGYTQESQTERALPRH